MSYKLPKRNDIIITGHSVNRSNSIKRELAAGGPSGKILSVIIFVNTNI